MYFAMQLQTPLSAALAELSLLNTSLPFQSLHRTLYPLTRSLPLILHHRLKIARTLVEALTNPVRTQLALSASHTIDVVPAFIQSLSPDPDFALLDFDTILTPLVHALVAIAVDAPSVAQATVGDRGSDPNSQTEISKRAFQVLAWTFREIGGDLVNKGDFDRRIQIAWSWVNLGLSGGKPQVAKPSAPEEAVETDVVEDDVDLQDEQAEGEMTIEGEQSPAMQEDMAPAADINAEELAEGEEVDDSSMNAGDALAPVQEEEEESGEVEEADASTVTDHRARRGRQRPASATKPHLRKLLATTFAFLVRKAKTGPSLTAVARTVLSSLDVPPEEDDADHAKLSESIAWILVESVKSVETHLHSRGPIIFKAFVDCRPTDFSIETEERKAQILEAALTALIHHSRLDQFSGLSRSLLSDLDRAAKELEGAQTSAHTLLSINLAEVLVGVRKASRLSDKEKAEVLALCERMSAPIMSSAKAEEKDLRRAFVQLAIKALLVAPSLEVMLTKGKTVTDRIWNTSEEDFALAAACIATLSEQRWTYFKDFALPLIVSSKQSHTSTYLALLARLAQDGNFSLSSTGANAEAVNRDLTGRVQNQLSSWLISWKNGKSTDRQGSELLDCLSLAAKLPRSDALAGVCASAIEQIATHSSVASAREEFADSAVNSAAILAAVMNTFSSLRVEYETSAPQVLELLTKYGWHRQVVQSAVAIVENLK